jgi:pyridoxal phosphate enzyme (YggS family)
MIAENVCVIKERIKQACNRVGRSPEDVKIVCVTKYADIEQIKQAITSGIQDIGESRVAQAKNRFRVIGSNVRWHMIGHLQTNKAKEAIEIFDYIHSIDNIRIVRELQKYLERAGKNIKAFVQVNVSGESTKSGINVKDTEDFISQCLNFRNINIIGLMTIAPYSENPEYSREYFRMLKQIRDGVRQNVSKSIEELSMGMTQDFEVAIEEGATMIRIGSGIFKTF